MSKKIIIAANSSWNLLNFRKGLIQKLISENYEVIALSPYDNYSSDLLNLGCHHLPISIENKGTNPISDILLLLSFLKVIREQKPDIFLSYTVKPNIYGSIAANMYSVPVINNISGLGSVFIRQNWITDLVKKLYSFALRGSQKIFFQNKDDRNLFIKDGLVNEISTEVLPGSGIDLDHFAKTPLPNENKINFLLVARMLWDKGVGEFVSAARSLREKGAEAQFSLLGFVDIENPSAISREEIEGWSNEGIIKFLGKSDDVRDQINEAHCVVLPSYREGTPRSLLEAAAMGRPIIAADSVGCSDVVDDKINGYLCRTKDSEDLARKMESILSLSPKELENMGNKSREKVENEYDERIVIDKYLESIKQILTKSN